jgi:hypothetical protein
MCLHVTILRDLCQDPGPPSGRSPVPDYIELPVALPLPIDETARNSRVRGGDGRTGESAHCPGRGSNHTAQVRMRSPAPGAACIDTFASYADLSIVATNLSSSRNVRMSAREYGTGRTRAIKQGMNCSKFGANCPSLTSGQRPEPSCRILPPVPSRPAVR